MATKVRDRKGEAFWRKVLRRRERSGLTVAAFCKREQLKQTAYYYWQREILRRDAEQRIAADGDSSASAPKFAPVRLVDDRESSSVEIVAPNGLVVRVAEQASSDHVRRVLQLVHEIS